MTESLVPCGFKFASGAPCVAPESHLIHHDGWRGPEPNHEYQPLERRHGERRRSASSREEHLGELLLEAVEEAHHTGSIRDHHDPTDKSGWNVGAIETCEDTLCVDALAALAALATAGTPSAASPSKPSQGTAGR